jgi:hypothetical protein
MDGALAETGDSPASVRYIPRDPGRSLLYQTIASNLETFLAWRQQRGRPVPGFVEEEFRAFLECGVLEYGFLRLRCQACGRDRLLAFSCKGRAFCPCCCGRRTADTAAYLVDRVIPHVPVRQWVLSLPYSVRYRAAFDGAFLGKVLGIFVREVFAWLRRGARDYGIPRGQCGSVTFVQRFGSALNCTPHFHTLVLDGVYAALPGESPRFYPLRPPEKRDVAAVAERVGVRVAALMESEADLGAEEDEVPPLGELYSASIAGRIASGPNAGQRLRTLGQFNEAAGPEDEGFQTDGPRCAKVSGFSVHAGVGIRAGDRKGLERLCRYAARPPVAAERLEQLPDGRLSYRLKTPWRNGTTHVLFEPLELLARLAALTPAPRLNLIRFHGVLGPAAKWRRSVVPTAAAPPLANPGAETPCDCGNQPKRDSNRRRNYTWAALMARVFEVDVLECPQCKGRLRILAAIHPPENTRKILECLNLPTRAPPIKAASKSLNEVPVRP